MKRNKNHWLKSIGNIGYGVVFFALALGFVVLFFLPIKHTRNTSTSIASQDCYKRETTKTLTLPKGTHFPGESTTVEDPNGLVLERLMLATPIIKVQAISHFNKLDVINYQGKPHQSYNIWFDAVQFPAGPDGPNIHGNSLSYANADHLEDLFFVDVTDDQSPRQEGMIYFDVFIRRGAAIPQFINEFCTKTDAQKAALQNSAFIGDQDGSYFPPRQFKTDDVINKADGSGGCSGATCTFPAGQTFYLFASSERNFMFNVGNTVYDLTHDIPPYYTKPAPQYGAGGILPHGDLVVEHNGVKKTYRFEWFGNSVSHWGALFNMDPNAKDSFMQYYYASSEFLGPPVDAPANLGAPLPSNATNNQLQIRALSPIQVPKWGWWTPECKPAIYLYPETKKLISVLLEPKGNVTYVDPDFNTALGWNVYADPLGSVQTLENPHKSYPYLYYESKLLDQHIDKPDEGFIVSKSELKTFYQKTLPLLGLNSKETTDYIEYWTKYLPEAPFYFVGIMSEDNIEYLEPLQITPKPDSVLRVRLYYQMLSAPEARELQSQINTPELENHSFMRNGFTVVEWGGMVKQDKDHPFTCSM